jgi:hypothetical protein
VPPQSSKARLEGLDAIKGMLVVYMLLFHTASAASKRHPDLTVVMEYLGFLHTAFLAISGYLCGAHYADSHAFPQGAGWRLFTRALKLIMVFLLINLALLAVMPSRRQYLVGTLNSARSIYQHVVISFDSNLGTFSVLYYIAVFLAIASLVVSRGRWVFLITMGACLAGTSYSSTLQFALVGLLGMAVGLCSQESLFRKTCALASRYLWLAPLSLIVWRLLSSFFYPVIKENILCTLLFLLLETCLWFWLSVAAYRLVRQSALGKAVVLLGRYTLLSYIVQMGIIVANIAVWGRLISFGGLYYVLNLAVSAGLLILALALLDRLRTRSAVVARSYRFIFQ